MTTKASSVKVNCDVYWVYHTKPADMSGKYEASLCNLSETAITNLEGMGLEVRFREDKPEQGSFIVCKSTLPITITDANTGEPITSIVGNGSRAIAVVGPYEWAFKGKKGVSASLKSLKITELVTVDGDTADEPV